MVLPCWPPADCPVHSRSRPEDGPAGEQGARGLAVGLRGARRAWRRAQLSRGAGGLLDGLQARAGQRAGEQAPRRGEQVRGGPGQQQRGGAAGGAGAGRWRGERRCPGVAARGAGVDGEAGAARREVGPGPGAARPDREHPPAPGLQRGHPQAAGRDLGPGPARVVGGPQLRPERPAVAAGQEPDLAHPGGAVGAVGGRRVDGAPGGAAGVGAPQHDAGGRGRLVALPGGQ